MTHYVCTGDCEGISDQAGVICQAGGCSRHKKPLISCNCLDGRHDEAYKKADIEEEDAE